MRILWLLLSVYSVHAAVSTCAHMKQSGYDVSSLFASQKQESLRICTGGSCCTRDIEEKFAASADRVFKAQLDDKIATLRRILDSHMQQFTSFFYTSLDNTHSHLDTMFKRTYGPFYEHNAKVFEHFFVKMRAFAVPGSTMDVREITEEMFSQLYKVVFQLLNPMQRVGESEWRCMSASIDDVKPFADLPEKIVAHLEKALGAWREFATLIQHTHIVLGGFTNASLSRECIHSLARMSDCSLCSSSSFVKPCPGMCLNVLKGCLADWADVDQQWTAVVGAIEKLLAKVRGANSLQSALSPLPVQISEAIMIFQEHGSTITNKVVAGCFDIARKEETSIEELPALPSFHMRGKRAAWLRPVMDQAEENWKVMQQMMNSFGDKLATMKGFFRRLPYEFCEDGEMSASKDEQCWDGEKTTSTYEKPVVGDGFANQKRNPEFQGALHLAYRGLFVDERLKLSVLAARVTKTADQLIEYERFEGSADSVQPDDEDFDGDSLEIVNLSAWQGAASGGTSSGACRLPFLLIIALVAVWWRG